MDVQQLLSRVSDAAAVNRVFGEPIVHDSVMVVPVATVRGGGGGGEGSEAEKNASGSGGGAGFTAAPVGVYVIKDGAVSWQPALNVTRLAIGGQLVAIVLALVLRSILRRK